MKKLRLKKPTHAGMSVAKITSNLIFDINKKYFYEPNFAAGYFENNELKCYICCYCHDNFWVLDLMVNDTSLINLQNVLSFCLQHFESKNINCFYYVFPQKWAKSYSNIWRDNNPALQKYTIEDLKIIDKKKRNTEDFIWSHILHQTVIPMNLLLRKSYVKH